MISIEHIGSTAIKEMSSKPIIDIAVAIDNYNKFNKVRQILSQNNYEDRGEKRGGYLFIKTKGELTTHHIHFVLSSSKKWREYKSFKKRLNSDKELRKEYSKLKQKLAKKFAENREEYTKSKSKFIDKVLRLIEDERLIRITFELADKSACQGFEPFGAILVKNNETVFCTQDKSIVYSDPTSHAELILISEYCRRNHIISLEGYTLYCNVEPCVMCCGAIHWSKISRVVFSVHQRSLQKISKGKKKPSCEELINVGNKKIEVIGGVLEEEGIEILRKYPFASKKEKHIKYLNKKNTNSQQRL